MGGRVLNYILSFAVMLMFYMFSSQLMMGQGESLLPPVIQKQITR
jgi:hypothetical protein